MLKLHYPEGSQITCQTGKCQFGQTRVNYLGHVISQGVAMDPDKVSAVLDWPKPTTLKGL